jgi:uncharacterized protein (DUF2141 family)
MNIKSIIAMAAIILASGMTKAQEVNNLKVILKKFEAAEGLVRVGLYNSKETYMGSAYKTTSDSVENADGMEVMFGNLPAGIYTISVYHDLNSNGELDKNFIGIPTEDYAFSNNADGRFGPPNYELCAFEIKEGDNIQIINLN